MRKKKKPRSKLIPLPKLLLKAQNDYFNPWIRERDKDDPCISCGKYHPAYDAGHYVPQGSCSFLRFHPWNVNKEGKGCNSFDKFHLIGYRKNLIEKIGLENVEWLEENRWKTKKWSRDELNLIIEKYKP
jgi:hypothetical protein